MFYYITDLGKKWQSVKSLDQVPPNAEHISALEIDEENPDTFAGDFYLDIDNSNLETAYTDALSLYTKFVGQFKVQPLVFFSGKKGFHIIIKEHYYKVPFEFVRNLHKIYKLMAKTIAEGISSVDLQAYAGGKGKLLRVVGSFRPETGCYKTFLPTDVFLSGLENVIAYSKVKREYVPPEPVDAERTSEQLTALYEAAKTLVEKKEQLSKLNATEVEFQFNGNDLPPCLNNLRYEKYSKNANFNDFTILISTYFRKQKDDALAFFEPLLQNYKSKTYNTYEKRRKHLEYMLDFVEGNPDYKFSCGFAKSKINDFSCLTCLHQQNISFGGDLQIKKEGYVRVKASKKGILLEPISNFILDPVYICVSDDTEHTNMTVNIITNTGKVFKRRRLYKEYLKDLRKFVNWLPAECWFSGTGVELQKIGSMLMSLSDGLLIKEVSRLGIHRIDKNLYFVDKKVALRADGLSKNIIVSPDAVVDAGYDLNLLDTDETEIPLLDVLALNKYLNVNFLRNTTACLKFNAPYVVTSILGWIGAAILRPLLKRMDDTKFKYFPVLFISGLSGSGKTQTAMLMRKIFGFYDLSLQNFNSTTNFVKEKYLAGSDIHPLFLDEFKKSLGNKNIEGQLLELLRQVYGSVEGFKGRADQSIVQYHRQAPLVLIGEEILREKAAYDRLVITYLKVLTSKKYKNTFKTWISSPHLQKIGLRLILKALQLYDKNKEIFYEWWEEGEVFVEEHIPEWAKFSERILYNYTFLWVGAKFFKESFGFSNWEVLINDWFKEVLNELLLMENVNPHSEVNTFFELTLDACLSNYSEINLLYRKPLDKKREELVSEWFKIEKNKDEGMMYLYVHLPQLYNQVLGYKKHYGLTDYIPDLQTLTLALSNAKAKIQEKVKVINLRNSAGRAVYCAKYRMDILGSEFGNSFIEKAEDLFETLKKIGK